jgi:uncharacterized membrane protein SirB2
MVKNERARGQRQGPFPSEFRGDMNKRFVGIAARFTSFWWGDKCFSVLLALLLCSLFLTPTLDTLLGQIIVGIFFTLLLVSGLSEVSSRMLPRIGAGLLVLTAIVLHWLEDVSPGPALSCWLTLISLIYFILLTWVVMRRAFRDGPVTTSRVRGAVSAYILLAITWSYIYQLIELIVPGSFHLTEMPFSLGERYLKINLTYFSFITLTTLGYGDITPLHPTARLFVIMEALLGQLYPATLLARLVSLEISSRQGLEQPLDATGNKPDSQG